MLKTIGARGRAVWTEGRLRALIVEAFGGEQVIVLTNREPIRHERTSDGQLAVTHSTGGVVSAVEPLALSAEATWIAHGSGTGDAAAVDERSGVDVVNDHGRYRLRRVWLDETEERGYYYGAANEGLWPLCHRAHVQPAFRPDDLNTYWSVNARFADAVAEEATGPSPFVLVQDYHLALAPSMIRERLPHSTIVSFWHIPWPSWQTFEICPWRDQLLMGLLGSDVIGVQTPLDCRNFLDAVEHTLEAHVDREEPAISQHGRRTLVRTYPASIEWPSRAAARSAPAAACRRQVRTRLGLPENVQLVVGVDRLDYTKGLVEKFLAVERLLDWFPQSRGRFAFAQLAAPSRDRLPAYRELRSRLTDVVARINTRFETPGYRPALLLECHYEPDQVYEFLRAADVCYVGSLQDGMNLVAKEFVAARDDERGALVLSLFTGAARQLPESLFVNPYDVQDAAATLYRALTMSDSEQRDRMQQLRLRVAEHSAYRWAGEMLHDAATLAREYRTSWQSEVARA
jgi:trehalose 6-phosphate synthase